MNNDSALFGTKISNTAELGGYMACEKIIDQQDVKAKMHAVLQDIQSGKFAHDFIADYNNDFSNLKKYRRDHDVTGNIER